jgi:hypothetical protein
LSNHRTLPLSASALRTFAAAVVVAAGLVAFPSSAHRAERTLPPDMRPAVELPERPLAAETGTELAERIEHEPEDLRKLELERALLDGNMPQALRMLRPVRLTADALPGHEAIVWVTPDYLSVGTDDDHLRVPLGLPGAARVAEAWGYLLPTSRIVDAIYAQAEVHVTPAPLPPTAEMRSIGWLLWHRELIRAQVGAEATSSLTAGQKKDVVLSNKLYERPDRVAIYGWHRAEGDPIQPVSLWHGARYCDYSHGIRLVHPTAYLDGAPVPLVELLASAELSALVSDEGPMADAAAILEHARTDDTLTAWAR